MALHRAEHLHDPGAELLDRASNLWVRYGRVAAIVLGVVVVAGGLGFMTLQSRARSEEQAADRLADANLLFWQGEYKRSMDVAKSVADQYPSSPSGIDGHRLAGDDAYWSGDFKTAVREYQAYLSRAKTGLLADIVRRSLAYALETDKQYAPASSLYQQLVGRFDRETSAEFLMDAARSEREAGHKADAIRLLQRLTNEFGETSYGNAARIEIAELSAQR